jgi:hypothetical protein
LPLIIPPAVANSFSCPDYDLFQGSTTQRDPGIEQARRVISTMFFCISSNESRNFDPTAHGQGPNGIAWGSWQLGDDQAAGCGARKGQHASDFSIEWQIRCALSVARKRCNLSKSGTSLFNSFENWAGVVHTRGKVNREAKEIIDKCMSDAGLPNWRAYMKQLPCKPCEMNCFLQNNCGVLIPDPTGGVDQPFPYSSRSIDLEGL